MYIHTFGNKSFKMLLGARFVCVFFLLSIITQNKLNEIDGEKKKEKHNTPVFPLGFLCVFRLYLISQVRKKDEAARSLPTIHCDTLHCPLTRELSLVD